MPAVKRKQTVAGNVPDGRNAPQADLSATRNPDFIH
jgi:hypothetical protein